MFFSLSQNNIPFQLQDNSVSIGKNSQIKLRKSEQGQGAKITRREYDKHQYLAISMLFALMRSNLPRQLPDGNGIILMLTEIVTVSNSIGTYFWELLQKNNEGQIIWEYTSYFFWVQL